MKNKIKKIRISKFNMYAGVHYLFSARTDNFVAYRDNAAKRMKEDVIYFCNAYGHTIATFVKDGEVYSMDNPSEDAKKHVNSFIKIGVSVNDAIDAYNSMILL